MRKDNRSGFTLIELLVVIAISTVVMVSGFVYLGGYRTEQNLKLSASELLATIQNTQSLSKSQQNGQKWGIHFVNTTSSAGQSYTVFSGTNFASGTVSRTYPLRRSISFGNPWASSSIDLIFNGVTGQAPSSQVISLITGRQDGFVNDISMNTLGQITSKFDTGIVGYWHLDEGTSIRAYDASGNGNNGTLNASPTWQSGSNCEAGSCLSFNGTSTYVGFGSSTITGTSPFTINGWLKVGSMSSYGLAVFIGNGVSAQSAWIGWTTTAQIGTSNSIGGGFFGRNYGSGITDSNWHQVTLTFSGGSSGVANLYVDGIQKVTDTYTPNLSSSNIIFGKGNSTAYWYNGSIDEVRIYNRTLSATEVSDLYNALQ